MVAGIRISRLFSAKKHDKNIKPAPLPVLKNRHLLWLWTKAESDRTPGFRTRTFQRPRFACHAPFSLPPASWLDSPPCPALFLPPGLDRAMLAVPFDVPCLVFDILRLAKLLYRKRLTPNSHRPTQASARARVQQVLEKGQCKT